MQANATAINGEAFYKYLTGQTNTLPGTILAVDVRTQAEIDDLSIPKILGDKLTLDVKYLEVSQLTAADKATLESTLGINDKQKILCMCKLGGRSVRAQGHLKGLGFDAINVEGGITGLKAYADSK